MPKGIFARAKEEKAIQDGGVSIHLNDAFDEPMYADDEKTIPSVIVSAGAHSNVAEKARKEVDKEISKHGLSKAQRQELWDKRWLMIAARCVLSWSGINDDEGTPIPLTVENAEKVLAIDWIGIQVIMKASGDKDFFVSPSKT